MSTPETAVKLIPPDFGWRYDSAVGRAEVFDLYRSPVFVVGSSDDPTVGNYPPALALCIAAVKAHKVIRERSAQ